MKASELITLLQDAIDKYGDLEVTKRVITNFDGRERNLVYQINGVDHNENYPIVVSNSRPARLEV